MAIEYIDREKAKRLLHIEYAYAAEQLLDEIPTADVTPVVRCKDCKHYDMGVCLKIYSDGNVHSEAWQPRIPEDFCSYGERKDCGDADR